jgi:hypothetical protein
VHTDEARVWIVRLWRIHWLIAWWEECSSPAIVGSWHIASFRSAAEFGRYWGIADIDQASPIDLDL